MATLQDVYRPVRKEMEDVERIIAASLSEGTVPELRKITRALRASPGKRLRPAMVLLSAHAGAYRRRNDGRGRRESIAKTAAAVELIHVSTLVHDDVMDASLLRHRKPTVNALHGDNVAICAGDYLLARAFMLLAETGNPALIGIASRAVKDVCEGQVLQVWRRGKAMGLKEYDAIIDRKTAALFRAACGMGACAAGLEGSALPFFGFHFGRGFQMIDDYLDIVSDEKTLGKRPGENIRQGELTLPALLLLQQVPKASRASTAGRCMEDMRLLRRMIAMRHVGESVRKAVNEEMRKAEQALDSLPASPCRQALHQLLDLSVSRLK